MPPEREDTTARPPHVAQQKLHDRGRAYVLDTDRVLRPSHRITNRGRSLAARISAQGLGDGDELFFRSAADALDRFRGVALKMLLEQLEDAIRMPQGSVGVPRLAVLEVCPHRAALVMPRRSAALRLRLLFTARRVRAHAAPGGPVQLHVLVLPRRQIVRSEEHTSELQSRQ